MYDEVFSPSFGNRPSFLVGRSQLLSQLEQGLQSRPGSRERTVVVLGQRGSGKTVLLWELADRMRKQGFAVASPTASCTRAGNCTSQAAAWARSASRRASN